MVSVMGSGVAVSTLLLSSVIGTMILFFKCTNVFRILDNVRPFSILVIMCISYALSTIIPLFVAGGYNPFTILAMSLILMTLPTYITLSTIKIILYENNNGAIVSSKNRKHKYVIDRRLYILSLIIAAILMAIGVYTSWLNNTTPYTLIILTTMYILSLPALCHRGFVEILHTFIYRV